MWKNKKCNSRETGQTSPLQEPAVDILPGPTPAHSFVNLGGSRDQIQYHGMSSMHLLLSTSLAPYLTLLLPDTSPEIRTASSISVAPAVCHRHKDTWCDCTRHSGRGVVLSHFAKASFWKLDGINVGKGIESCSLPEPSIRLVASGW